MLDYNKLIVDKKLRGYLILLMTASHSMMATTLGSIPTMLPSETYTHQNCMIAPIAPRKWNARATGEATPALPDTRLEKSIVGCDNVQYEFLLRRFLVCLQNETRNKCSL